MKLDLVIPLYNPASGWEIKFVSKFGELVDRYFAGNKDFINLVLVNDGSPRNFTDKEINYLKEQIPHIIIVNYQENKGKGHALRQGVQSSVTDYCVYSDYDFPFGLDIIHSMYEELVNGADVVTGSRLTGNYFGSLPFKRKLVSRGLVIFNKYFLSLPVYDTQAGIKGFNKYGKAMFLKTTINRFLFDMEFVLLSSRVKGMVIKPLDVRITVDTVLSDFGIKVLKQEFTNLLQIVFKKRIVGQRKEDII